MINIKLLEENKGENTYGFGFSKDSFTTPKAQSIKKMG